MLPLADAEQTYGLESTLFYRLQRAFDSKPYFKHLSMYNNEPATDELPYLHISLSCSERPPEAHSLLSRIPPKRLRRFVNKDTILYVRPTMDWMRSNDCLARDIFRGWYPYRPPLPTHTSADMSAASREQTNEHSAITEISGPSVTTSDTAYSSGPLPTNELRLHRPRSLPTSAEAYTCLQQAFCVPMSYFEPKDGEEGLALPGLIRAHVALVRAVRAVLDEIRMPAAGLHKGWCRGLVRLGGGFGDGFCIHDGPILIGEERYLGEIRDTRASRELKIVGREPWVRRGWGVDGEIKMELWDEVKGVEGVTGASEEGTGKEKWLTRVMGMQEAVEGVVRASGEEGRFEAKPVGKFFRGQFLEPRRKSDEEVRKINKERDALMARFAATSRRAREEQAADRDTATKQ
jgi:hypothetical protein